MCIGDRVAHLCVYVYIDVVTKFHLGNRYLLNATLFYLNLEVAILFDEVKYHCDNPFPLIFLLSRLKNMNRLLLTPICDCDVRICQRKAW